VAGAFDEVICQLVISIVGLGHDRAARLANLYTPLRPGGFLYLSASGISDDINRTYADLYRSDLETTKVMHAYVSRDDQGRGLYVTHHFSVEELSQLLLNAGFTAIRIDKRRETSSRERLSQYTSFIVMAASLSVHLHGRYDNPFENVRQPSLLYGFQAG